MQTRVVATQADDRSRPRQRKARPHGLATGAKSHRLEWLEWHLSRFRSSRRVWRSFDDRAHTMFGNKQRGQLEVCPERKAPAREGPGLTGCQSAGALFPWQATSYLLLNRVIWAAS